MANGAGNFIGSIIGGAMTGGIGPAIGAALPGVTEIAKVLAERLVPDPAARAAAQAEIEKTLAARDVAAVQAGAEIAKAQIGVNLAEATGNDRFSARWRPAVGWICACGFGYQFVVAPILTWATNLAGVMIGAAIPPAPTLNINDLLVVLTGILGLGVQRTYERTTGVPGALPGVTK